MHSGSTWRCSNPGHSLPSQDPFDPCLAGATLDAEAVTGLSS